MPCAKERKQVETWMGFGVENIPDHLPVSHINLTNFNNCLLCQTLVGLVTIHTDNVHFLPTKSSGISSKVALKGV